MEESFRTQNREGINSIWVRTKNMMFCWYKIGIILERYMWLLSQCVVSVHLLLVSFCFVWLLS